MVKVTVLSDQPDDPAAFEKYYLDVHVPEYGLKIPNVTRVELNKAFPAVGQPPFLPKRGPLFRQHGVVSGINGVTTYGCGDR